MYPNLTPEVLKILKDNPLTASIGENLEKEEFVPKSRFNDVNDAKKLAEQKIAEAEAKRIAEEQERLAKQGEFKTLAEQERAKREAVEKLVAEQKAQFEAEKKIADEYRSALQKERDELKKLIGDDWLPEYDAPTFSLESIRKVAKQHEKLGTFSQRGRHMETNYNTMSGTDFEKEIQRAKSGG